MKVKTKETVREKAVELIKEDVKKPLHFFEGMIWGIFSVPCCAFLNYAGWNRIIKRRFGSTNDEYYEAGGAIGLIIGVVLLVGGFIALYDNIWIILKIALFTNSIGLLVYINDYIKKKVNKARELLHYPEYK